MKGWISGNNKEYIYEPIQTYMNDLVSILFLSPACCIYRLIEHANIQTMYIWKLCLHMEMELFSRTSCLLPYFFKFLFVQYTDDCSYNSGVSTCCKVPVLNLSATIYYRSALNSISFQHLLSNPSPSRYPSVITCIIEGDWVVIEK